MGNFWRATWSMYIDGFKSMTIGRKLWLIIIVKLAVFFLILKLFFFPDILSVNYSNDGERADAVRNSLTTTTSKPIKNN